ncbi:SGNH/GDSL hydrolase family protein [bacterium]|nr:SGNH/GDSL hydrolase family protein [bacterium]
MSRPSFFHRIWRNRRNLLILAGCVVFLEIVLRFVFPVQDETYFYRRPGDDNYVEDRELFWVPGDRYASQWSVVDATPAANLIYTFGGSIATECCGATTNFSRIVDEKLPDFRVANMATAGFTSFQSRRLLERAFKRKPARVTLFCHAFNDMGPAYHTDKEMWIRNQRFSTKAQWFLMRLKTLALLRRGIRAARGFDPYAGDPRPARVTPAEYWENLAGAAKHATRFGGRVVFVTQGYADAYSNRAAEPYFKEMRRIAEAMDRVEFMDVRPVIEARIVEKFGAVPELYDFNRLAVHTDYCHLTDEGHALVADLIVSFLRAKGYARPATPTNSSPGAS